MMTPSCAGLAACDWPYACAWVMPWALPEAGLRHVWMCVNAASYWRLGDANPQAGLVIVNCVSGPMGLLFLFARPEG